MVPLRTDQDELSQRWLEALESTNALDALPGRPRVGPDRGWGLGVLRAELDPEPADRRQVSARVVAGSTSSTSATTATPATKAATSG